MKLQPGNAARDARIERLERLVPSIGHNIRASRNFRRFAALLKERTPRSRVLVLGGRILGKGMEAIAHDPTIALVETDVAIGPRTRLVCDAQQIPFRDGSFDGVVVQGVVELLPDPYAAVDQIHRVLRKDGLVYAETPFMQQGLGSSDFTRFTDLGHRRLFRRFDEIDRGAVCGPGMALAWSYQYFLLSFATSRTARWLVQAFTTVTAFWLKYFDYLLIDTPGGIDAASGYYFLGRKSEHTLPDRSLVALYRGAK